MQSDPIAPGIAPFALLRKKGDFLPHLANQYRYEVLGGLYTIAAKKELLHDMPSLPSHQQLSIVLPILYLIQDIQPSLIVLLLCIVD